MVSPLFTIVDTVMNALAFRGTFFFFSKLIEHGKKEKNEATAHLKSVDEVRLLYYRVFAKQINPLPPEPQLSDFYHPSEGQKLVISYLL